MADAPAPIRCDSCNALARRRLRHVCLDHWFFIESKVDHSKKLRVHVVYACSEACRDRLWQRGPGPNSIDEDGTKRMRAKENASG